MLGNGVLHAKPNQRRRKQQHAINNMFAFFLRPQRQRHAQHAENNDIGNQEKLAVEPVFRPVVADAPQAADPESE